MDDFSARAASADDGTLPARSCVCGRTIPEHRGRGRPKQYCCDDCRPGHGAAGTRSRPQPAETERSYVVRKLRIGACSSDYSYDNISLARRAI